MCWGGQRKNYCLYWRIQLSKTSNPNLKVTYKEAYERAHQRFIEDPLTQQISLELRLKLEKWAESPPKGGGAKILSSSAVEGHNGVLSQLNYCRRGLGQKRLLF